MEDKHIEPICVIISYIGEGKSSQSLGNQIIAAGGVVLSEFPTDVRELSHIIMYVCMYLNGTGLSFKDVPTCR